MSQLAPYETPQVRAALESAEASGVTAETAARSIEVARSLGLPSSVVVSDLNYASREQEARKLEGNPQLAQWTAASESNAAVAREDSDGLVAVFDAVANLGADVLHGITFGMPVAARKVGYSLTHGAADFNEGLAGASLLASENLFGERSLPAQWSRNALEWIERKRPPEVSVDSSAAQFGLDFVRSVPQQAGNIMAAFVNPAAVLGMMGAQIAGHDYVDLRKKGVSPGRSGASALLDATAQAPMERLALDRFLRIFKSTGFADTVKRMLGSAGTEFVTEYVQKAPELVSRLWGESEKHGSAPDEQIAWFARTLFNADTLLQAHNEAWYEASIASVWGLLGGVGRVALSAEARRTQAESFAAQQRDLHAVIEDSKTKRLSPEIMQSALDAAGLNHNASVPASAVLELYQNETDIITPLGWNLEDVQTAAALGQDIDVRLSHLHASLNQDQINAVSPFLREDADAPTFQETAAEADSVRESANAAAEEIARFQAEENEMDVELERLRTEMKEALGSVPGIQTSLKADATQEESARGQTMTPEKAAEYTLSLHAAFARRLSAYGVNPAEYLRKVNVRGLVNEAREKSGMSRAQQRAALLESPIAETIYGRLDRAAIREAYGQDTVNAIVARYGKGMFAKTRGAKAVDRRMLSNDSLANELVRHGLLPEGSSLDDMVNYLATGEGVDTGRALYQPAGMKPSLPQRFAEMPGVEADSAQWFGEGKAIPLPGKSETPEQRKALRGALKQWAKENFSKDTAVANADTGWQVQVTPKGIEDSLSHGFDDLLARSVPFIPQIVEGGIHVASTEKKAGLMSHIFANKIRLDGKDYVVGFVVREDDNGNRFYDHELTEIINPERLVPGPALQKGNVVHRTNRGDVMNILRDKLGVNDGSGQVLFHDSGPASARGKVELVGDDYLISLFKKSDLSTLLHETGHVFLLEMDRVLKAGLGDERLRTDFDTIRAWLDAKPGEAFTREQHEKFARGFEAWLREGKAPTRNLESAFARFKKWLTRIYRKVTELNVELTDDVRDVFSRLLATDMEIEAAARNSGLLDMDAKYLEALGVPEGAERVYASGLMKAARDAGAARLRAARDVDRKQQLAAWSKKARQEIADDPLYSAMRDLRKEPLDLDAVRESLGDELAERLRKRVPGGLKRGGKNPEVFAAEHGFQDGAGFMIDQMVDAPNVAERVRELLAEYQRMHDLLHDPADALLATEEAAAQAEFAGRYIARAAGSQAVEQEAVALAVDESLQSMSMDKAVRANVFKMAMKRALERERRAVAQGDFAAALEANTQSRLNMEFARRAADMRQGVEKLQKAARRFSRSPRPASMPRYMVMALAAKYGLIRYDERLADGKNGEQIDAWLKEMENEGYPLSLDVALAEGESRPWRDMSVTEFESLASDLHQIMAVERNKRTVMTANGRKELDALADEIVASIRANVPQRASKVVGGGSTAEHFIAKAHSELLKVDTIARLLDGDKLGVTWQSIMRPINRATWDEAERFKKVRPELARIFSVFSSEEFRNMRRKKEYVKEIGASMTREQRLAVLLNCGNEENMQRLMKGYDWSPEQVQAILTPLTKRDWDFAQNVWDYMESFREESFSLEESLTGVRPKAVKASPLRSPFGKTYRGGYYPVKYDPAQSARAPDPGDVSTRPAGLFASVDHGFLKERSKLGLGAPLYLRLDVIPDHVAQTVHNLAFREPVMQVAKVLRNSKVQAAIQQAVGVQQYRRIWDMLKNVAGDSPKSMGSVDKVLSWARSNMALFTMGYKVTTMAVQATGILSTVTEIGPKWTAVGVKRTYANPLRAYREATALSPMMANRIRNVEREVSEQMKRLGVGDGFAGLHAKLKRNAFTPMGIVQMGVDLPTWWGAYEKKMQETGGDERAAVEFADNVVEITQVGGAKKDLAGIQSGNEIAKMVTMFMSYFNALYNISTRRLTMAKRRKDLRSIGHLAATVILLWFMEPVLSELLAGRGPDEDDGEEWGPWLAKQALTNPFNMIPVVRDVVNYFIKDEVRSFTASPAISSIEMILKAGAALGNAAVDAYNGEEFWDAQRGKALARGIGAATGSPIFNAQMITTVSNFWDWLDGTDPEFEIRDLFYVKPKSRR